jgi:hypothetical protein
VKLPENLDPDLLVDRPRGRQLITEHRFPVTERKLRDWPLSWVYIHGRACISVAELFAEADRILREASHQPTRETERARIAARFRRRHEAA